VLNTTCTIAMLPSSHPSATKLAWGRGTMRQIQLGIGAVIWCQGWAEIDQRGAGARVHQPPSPATIRIPLDEQRESPPPRSFLPTNLLRPGRVPRLTPSLDSICTQLTGMAPGGKRQGLSKGNQGGQSFKLTGRRGQVITTSAGPATAAHLSVPAASRYSPAKKARLRGSPGVAGQRGGACTRVAAKDHTPRSCTLAFPPCSRDASLK
jgi:hypothetical protein